MGCWNETCFLTHLPILAGDDVRLLFVTENHELDRKTVHPNSWFKPASLPLYGWYNEYGGIENIEHDKNAVDLLCTARFRIRRPGKDEPEHHNLNTPGPGYRDWSDHITKLVSYAVSGDLEVYYKDPAHPEQKWHRVLVQIAHKWAYDYLAYDWSTGFPEEDLKSVETRLSVAGPLRELFRSYAMEQVPGKEEPARVHKSDIAGMLDLIRGMSHMRLAFGPTSGSGSQESLYGPYQLEWYRRIFIKSQGIGHKCDEDTQPEFCMSMAWDGNYVTGDVNNEPEEMPDIPNLKNPAVAREQLLSAGTRMLLNAMDADGEDALW